MNSNSTYQDFVDHFITQIRAIERGHTDETGSFDYSVGFNVVCRHNNRVMYFEKHLNSNEVPPNPTDQDIVDTGWSNLLPSVKTWAATACAGGNLLGSVYVPNSNLPFTTQSNIDLPTYTSNFTTKVARFEVYPPIKPTSWCVGFSISKNSASNDYMYVDTNIPVQTFANTLAETEILNMGWSNTKETIGVWAEKKMADSQLLNIVYTNSNIW